MNASLATGRHARTFAEWAVAHVDAPVNATVPGLGIRAGHGSSERGIGSEAQRAP